MSTNVRVYIENRHGTTSFASEENNGTRFRIELPIKKTGLTHKELLEITKNDLQTGRQILIVEGENQHFENQTKGTDGKTF